MAPGAFRRSCAIALSLPRILTLGCRKSTTLLRRATTQVNDMTRRFAPLALLVVLALAATAVRAEECDEST
jgi:flagellar biosynthesis protein FliQ